MKHSTIQLGMAVTFGLMVLLIAGLLVFHIHRDEVRHSFFGEELLPFSNEENFACIKWALGEDFLLLDVTKTHERWAELHPDLPQWTKDTWPDDFFDMIANEWRKKIARHL